MLQVDKRTYVRYNEPMMKERIADLVDAPAGVLDQRVRDLELQRRRLEAELAETIAVAEARQIHLVDGHRSMKGYLRAACNWSNGEVARLRSSARVVDAHDSVGEAWHSGRVGGVQVAELAKVHANRRVADRFAAFVPILLEQAETLRFEDFKLVVQHFVNLADADGAHDDRDAIDQRTARAVHVDGRLDLRVSGGDRLATAEFLEILDRFTEREFQQDLAIRRSALANDPDAPIPEPRTKRQIRFDAVVAMARSAAAHDGVASRAEPLVSVVVDQRTMSWVIAHSGLGSARSLTGDSIDPFTGLPQPADLLDDLLGDPASFLDRRCQTENGVPLRPVDVLRAALSGHTRRVVLGARRVPVDMGRSVRVFTGAARDAATLLVDTCDHPGCDVPAAWCQVDHSTEWADSGETNQANAGIECGFHNRDKHRKRRRTRRSVDGRMHTFRADGTIMLPVGCRPPRFDDADEDDQRLDLDDVTPEQEQALAEAARARLALLGITSPAR